MNKIYIAGPMTGLPYFNFPAFHAVDDYYKSLGWETFNPARKDEEIHGEDFAASNITGCPDQAADAGFSLRDALAMDLNYICKHATHIYMLSGWERSRGAMAEHATAVALGLTIIYEDNV